MPADLRILDLRKEFESHDGGATVVAVDDVTLEVEKGTLITLLGPSGCGKTTLLRMIAGFEEPTKGQIWFGDKRVDRLAPNLRDTAMVFQSYAIFPHLNVFENVAFGLRMKRLSKEQVAKQVNDVLELVGLGHLGHRQPSQLSGGQQQRVALARSIVMEPRLLLFDEPLSNLDAKLREQMRQEIRELQQRLGITSVYVTHDQIEAMSMSDLVVVMNAGRVEQVGTPLEIYARPVNRFVADFIGNANFVEVQVVDAERVRLGAAVLPLAEPTAVAVGGRVTVVVRPESLELGPAPAGGARGERYLSGRVTRATFLGSHAEYLVNVEGVGELQADVRNPVQLGLLQVGDEVTLTSGALHALPVG